MITVRVVESIFPAIAYRLKDLALRSQVSSEGLKSVLCLLLRTTYRSSEAWKRCQAYR